MGHSASTGKIDYPVPRNSQNRQKLVCEALARQNSTISVTGRNFLSDGNALGRERRDRIWKDILSLPKGAQRRSQALKEMSCFADVVTVVFTKWSAIEITAQYEIPLSGQNLKNINSITISNWTYLIQYCEDRGDLDNATFIQQLLSDACERL